MAFNELTTFQFYHGTKTRKPFRDIAMLNPKKNVSDFFVAEILRNFAKYKIRKDIGITCMLSSSQCLIKKRKKKY